MNAGEAGRSANGNLGPYQQVLAAVAAVLPHGRQSARKNGAILAPRSDRNLSEVGPRPFLTAPYWPGPYIPTWTAGSDGTPGRRTFPPAARRGAAGVRKPPQPLMSDPQFLAGCPDEQAPWPASARSGFHQRGPAMWALLRLTQSSLDVSPPPSPLQPPLFLQPFSRHPSLAGQPSRKRRWHRAPGRCLPDNGPRRSVASGTLASATRRARRRGELASPAGLHPRSGNRTANPAICRPPPSP